MHDCRSSDHDVCPVCGAVQPKAPWTACCGGSLEICPSCGIQFGYNDAREDLRPMIHVAWREMRRRNGQRPVFPVPTSTS